MTRMSLAVLLSIPLAALPPAAAAAQARDYRTGNHTRTFPHGGLTRRYVLRLPPGYPTAGAYPLVLMLHGRGGNADTFLNTTRMSPVADANEFVLVYPDGTEDLPPNNPPERPSLVFNAGFNLVANPAVDDVGFLGSLLTFLEGDLLIDTSRVYVAGFSMGAMMAYKMAAEMPRRFAALGVVAGTLGSVAPNTPDALQPFVPPVPMPLAAFHSTDDNAVQYRGCAVPSSYFPVVDPHSCAPHTSLGYYRDTVNGCTTEQVEVLSATVTRFTWADCASPQVTMQFYRLTTGRHTWPGGPGEANQDVSAAERLWAFFSAHQRLPEP
jgi:polyhydroxybutyrate depolymerase